MAETWAGQKILVTGGAGFIGSAIARRLLDLDAEVRVLDNLLTGAKENVPEGAEFVDCDIRDLAAVEEGAADVDVVFHEAALRSVPRSLENPQLSMSCNVEGTLNVLMAAEKQGVRRLVYASSSSVYGDVGERPNHEDMPTNPLSPYAVSKLAGEQYCRVWGRLGRLPTVSLRYFNVFGPGQHPESKYAAVFPAFMAALTAGRPPEVHWDGEQARDFTFIDDVVDANIAAASVGPEADGQVINIGGGRTKTVNEVLESLSKVMDVWIEPARLPKREGDIRITSADIARGADLLGWRPRVVWDDAIAATVEWYRERFGPRR